MAKKRLLIEHLGIMPYEKVWNYQKKLVQNRLDHADLDDVLLLVEHPTVYTLGTGSTLDNLKFDLNNFSGQLFRTERGGEVTYHCLGQIVVYPILNLRNHQQDLHWYLRQLEEVVIQLLTFYGVEGARIEGLTGVWVNDEKICAMGIKVKRWITMHGLALNVDCDLEGFGQIIPCGIRDKSVTRLVNFVPDVSMEEVKKQLVMVFKNVFGYDSNLENS
ncbi:lipoyl(octanoyl) transferase LipB [Cyanobacterium sp. IPPAS B-1200]|uniref:lipoyl(octanoyl) transferase LipB n=1 Tax=Cyanobacterium sp. IPPAS B-1200 TaxID=1562720 RepID=UPI00085274C7|nr:lipoyl(octanoyl) transferase LipB [Cyanobacterium sp. IPPAS B-1200]OEJ78394.1 lipoyl(octanoyl) transferase [Cyanobacterium sp. IPPAS B-1200]